MDGKKKEKLHNAKNQVSNSQVVVATGQGLKVVADKGKKSAPVKVLVEPDDVLREQAGGFANFLKEYAVVGLAVGFIIGQQANAVVKQFVTSFVEPLLQFIFGASLSKQTAVVHHGHKAISVPWGAFVYIFIEFLFVAVAVYVVIKLLRLDKLKSGRGMQ